MIDRLGGFFGSREADEEFDDDSVDEADLDPPPSPVGQDERRMQVRAYNHWASLLGDANFPHIADLDPGSLGDFGPFSVLLDLSQDLDDPKIAFVGDALADECGIGADLPYLSKVGSRSVLSRITDHYMQIVANQAPIGFEAEFANENGAAMLYRGILLPYSSDDTTVDFIYGVINWKEVADQSTADELLLAIDQALGESEDSDAEYSETVETAETLTTGSTAPAQPKVLELAMAEMDGPTQSERLPLPTFGGNASVDEPMNEFAPAGQPRGSARLDALGNPLGGTLPGNPGPDDYDDDFDSGIKTAADYGLPDWDEAEEDEDDVDGVVDPLADEETSSSLISLVSRGDRTKKSVDLAHGAAIPQIPESYEGEGVELTFQAPAYHQSDSRVPISDDVEFGTTADSMNSDIDDVVPTSPPVAPDVTEAPSIEPDTDAIEFADAPEGLYDCLAAARELAAAAQNTEDRSRKTLYSAVARAYDFSLEAQENRGEFDALLQDNGLTIQDRAPMTPVVKLVFGADYDKTRLTEYAAVLMHAHRVGVERGKLDTFLREADGGLKGVVNAERRARKEEQGKPVEHEKAVRSALAKKLRALDAVSLHDLESDGAEFALVMVRRSVTGAIEVVGEVPEDIALVERAARKLLG